MNFFETLGRAIAFLFKWLIIAAICAAFPSCIYWAEFSEGAQERKAQQAEQVQRDKLPRKVNDSEGCEVWAFKPNDRWLYFTKCGNARTETKNTWEECRQSGKTRTCTNQEMAIASHPKEKP